MGSACADSRLFVAGSYEFLHKYGNLSTGAATPRAGQAKWPWLAASGVAQLNLGTRLRMALDAARAPPAVRAVGQAPTCVP